MAMWEQTPKLSGTKSIPRNSSEVKDITPEINTALIRLKNGFAFYLLLFIELE